MAQAELERAIADLGLTVNAMFVPWSKSRNAKPKAYNSDRSLNWQVTVKHNGRIVLTTDYMAGIGHCPSVKASVAELGGRDCILRSEKIVSETETGRHYRNQTPLQPDTVSVIACLIIDASALDSSSFEDWADEFGYDRDSRKAEKVYRECLETALRLRAGIGDEGIKRLQEAAQDY